MHSADFSENYSLCLHHFPPGLKRGRTENSTEHAQVLATFLATIWLLKLLPQMLPEILPLPATNCSFLVCPSGDFGLSGNKIVSLQYYIFILVGEFLRQNKLGNVLRKLEKENIKLYFIWHVS